MPESPPHLDYNDPACAAAAAEILRRHDLGEPEAGPTPTTPRRCPSYVLHQRQMSLFLSVTILDPTASGLPARAKNSIATPEVVPSLDLPAHATEAPEGNAASFGWYCLGSV